MTAILASCATFPGGSRPPLALHPENPHYFLFRGEPTVLITSGEHYGAVVNLDFDYVKYLETLEAHGFNMTRIWAGAYIESEEVYPIPGNSLGPAPGRFICPWARSDEPGYAAGGNKFDLSRFDEAYFARLRDFMTEASRRGVVVEMNLFCPAYGDAFWGINPMHEANNVNGLPPVAGRNDALTLDKHGGRLPYQEAMVRRIVEELRDFDNLFYEVCNEPYTRVPMDWQHHMTDVIIAAEASFPKKHLISYNIANGSEEVKQLHPAVSIINFHYCTPPDAVAMNYGLGLVIGDNETGGKGIGDRHYRMEGWEFMLAGGGLYNHLDFSFTVGHEDGSYVNPPNQYGGGSPALREQLSAMKKFIEGFDFVRMKPVPGMILGGVPKGARAQALGEEGKAYAIYVTDGGCAELELELPAGAYRVEWLNPLTGQIDKTEAIEHTGGPARLVSPEYPEDMALSVRRI